jgi:uncharacterized protein YwqG
MTKELAIALINDSGLPEAAELIQLLRPSARITTERIHAEPLHDGSKFGGLPLLPAGFEWPRWDKSLLIQAEIEECRRRLREGMPAKFWSERIAKLEAEQHQPGRLLDFLAEIKLSDTVGSDTNLKLPQQGRLLFFYDVEESTWGFRPEDVGAWRVVYLDDAQSWSRVAPPTERANSFHPCVLSFNAEYTLSTDMRDYGVDLHIWEKGSAFHELYKSLVEDPKVIHRLGGYAEAVQNSMELECQLVSNGLYCGNASGYQDPRRKVLEEGAKEWRLLLQIDSDDKVGWMWGDVGRLYFWIRESDLQQRDFDNVWCLLQCH